MARPKPPPLYRLSRLLRRLGVVVVVIIVAYLAFAGYSIFKLSGSDVSGLNTIQPTLGDQGAAVSGTLSVTNPGVAPVNVVDFKARVWLQNGTNLANIGLPSVSLGPAAETHLNFSFQLSLENNSPAAVLLFEDNSLRLLFTLNVTYAYLFNASVRVGGSFDWGAPFFGFTANASPSPSNPAVDVVTYSFSNHARFGIGGYFLFNVTGPNGAPCGGNSTPALDVPGGQDALGGGTVNVPGSASCFGSATVLTVTYFVEPRISIVFPPERIT